MVYAVSITSQGQISIPVKIRRKLGLKKRGRAIVSEENGKIVVRPVKDFMELRGLLHNKAIKGKTIDEIIELETAAAEEGFAENYINKLKR